MQILQDLHPPRMKIDWKAYYVDAFKPLHGGNPVEHAGRLLFQDGWGYSLTDVKGPEYPPPDDPWELHWLKVEYWRKRKKLAQEILQSVQITLQYLEDLGRSRSAALQCVVHARDPDTRRLKLTHKGDVDLGTYANRAEQLKHDVEHSAAKLAELGERNAR